MNLRHRRSLPCAAVAAFCLAFTPFAIVFAAASGSAPDATSRYVVRFGDVPLARYNAVVATSDSAAIPVHRLPSGRARLDVGSAAAKSYLDYLHVRQQQHLADIAATIGRVPANTHSMQHAVSAAILTLSSDEARRLAGTPGVVAVEPDHALELDSDVGPGFTGAASVWWGVPAGQDSIFARSFDDTVGFRGDGVVIGLVDTGYNSLSPSFQARDLRGIAISNPLGSGKYLGQCNVPGISLGGCNDKVIGVYDEVGLTSGAANPVYTVEDQVGHGSHTASIAAGDLRMASLGGYSTTISGVAPHANLVVYRACSPDPAVGCPYSALLAAVDQAIADGVVDALNYSISGGVSPWADSVSLAFLSAADAGIFVAAAGGNTTTTAPNQTPGTVLHQEPWVTTVASGSHSGGALLATTSSSPPARATAQPDRLAATSLIGPAHFDVVKPDLQAPGVAILAAVANDGSAGGAALVGMKDGTSMATAHMTGAGALLLGLHPDWTALEAKSALMMTAKEAGLTKADGVTPSDWFDRGSGRVQEFAASRAGLVLDETGDRLSNANTATGGDPSTLNLASMQNRNCVRACGFDRWFRNTQDRIVTWTAQVVTGPQPGFTTVSISPAKFSLKALAVSQAVTFRADTSSLAADGMFHFAEIVLTADDSELPPLHLTIAVAVPPA